MKNNNLENPEKRKVSEKIKEESKRLGIPEENLEKEYEDMVGEKSLESHITEETDPEETNRLFSELRAVKWVDKKNEDEQKGEAA